MKKKTKSYKYFFRNMGLLFPFFLIIVFLISIFMPERSFSEKENRVLASKPDATVSSLISGKFKKKYDTYVNDQFPLRDMWVELKAGADLLMGKTRSNGVYLGKMCIRDRMYTS